MSQHVISIVCSKLKGHNGDPFIVFFSFLLMTTELTSGKVNVGQLLQ